jgi:hypothetical protein
VSLLGNLRIADPADDADLATQRDLLLGALVDTLLRLRADPFGGVEACDPDELRIELNALLAEWAGKARRVDTAELRGLARLGRKAGEL